VLALPGPGSGGAEGGDAERTEPERNTPKAVGRGGSHLLSLPAAEREAKKMPAAEPCCGLGRKPIRPGAQVDSTWGASRFDPGRKPI
jgi:hypothetical protein